MEKERDCAWKRDLEFWIARDSKARLRGYQSLKFRVWTLQYLLGHRRNPRSSKQLFQNLEEDQNLRSFLKAENRRIIKGKPFLEQRKLRKFDANRLLLESLTVREDFPWRDLHGNPHGRRKLLAKVRQTFLNVSMSFFLEKRIRDCR